MQKVKSFFKRMMKDESGQGATEYILLVVVVVGLVMMFGPRVKTALANKVGDIESKIGGFTGD